MSVFQLKDFVDDGMEGRGLLTDPVRAQHETQEGDVVLGIVKFGVRHGIVNVLRVTDDDKYHLIPGKKSFYRHLPLETQRTTFLATPDVQSFVQRNRLAPSFGAELKGGHYSSFDRVVRVRDPKSFEHHFLQAALEDGDHPWVLHAQWQNFFRVEAAEPSSKHLEVTVMSDAKMREKSDQIFFTIERLLATYAGYGSSTFEDRADEVVLSTPVGKRGLEDVVYDGLCRKLENLQDIVNLGFMSLVMRDSEVSEPQESVVRKNIFVGTYSLATMGDAE